MNNSNFKHNNKRPCWMNMGVLVLKLVETLVTIEILTPVSIVNI